MRRSLRESTKIQRKASQEGSEVEKKKQKTATEAESVPSTSSSAEGNQPSGSGNINKVVKNVKAKETKTPSPSNLEGIEEEVRRAKGKISTLKEKVKDAEECVSAESDYIDLLNEVNAELDAKIEQLRRKVEGLKAENKVLKKYDQEAQLGAQMAARGTETVDKKDTGALSQKKRMSNEGKGDIIAKMTCGNGNTADASAAGQLQGQSEKAKQGRSDGNVAEIGTEVNRNWLWCNPVKDEADFNVRLAIQNILQRRMDKIYRAAEN